MEGSDGAGALVALMERLRKECPWDRKQTARDLSGYLLEECYEVLDALSREDWKELEGELGDLLFQIVFLARLGEERGAFDFESVARRIHDKMVARHPHVFGDAAVRDAEGVRVQWEELKRKEREKEGRPPSPFDGVPRALPALLKAVRLTSRAADLGFDWERDADVLVKLDEEVAEFKAELLGAGRRAQGARGRRDRRPPLHRRERRPPPRRGPRGRAPVHERQVPPALRGSGAAGEGGRERGQGDSPRGAGRALECR